MKYGITIQFIGGINVFDEGELLSIEYSNDSISRDLISYTKY